MLDPRSVLAYEFDDSPAYILDPDPDWHTADRAIAALTRAGYSIVPDRSIPAGVAHVAVLDETDD